MRIGIGFKLFAAVLVASIVMAVAMGIANRVSFQRGFLGYLNELESRRMSVLTPFWRPTGARWAIPSTAGMPCAGGMTCGVTSYATAATACIPVLAICPCWCPRNISCACAVSGPGAAVSLRHDGHGGACRQ